MPTQVMIFENLVFIQVNSEEFSSRLSNFIFHFQDGIPCHHFQLSSSEIAQSIDQFDFFIIQFPFY
jgi:hypothetical protein